MLFFGNSAPIYADITLILQIAMFVLLIFGWSVARRRRFPYHSKLMVIALSLHTVTIALVMIPSLIASRGIFQQDISPLAVLVASHAILGGLAEILGIYMVGRWLLNQLNVKPCLKKKGQMRTTLITWLLALATGIYLYFVIYPIG